jgi:hypothetical protein
MKKARGKSKAKQAAADVSQREIGQLQQNLLRSVLTGQPLPGSTRPINFPDLSFVLRQPTILVNNANLATPLAMQEHPKPMRIVSQRDIDLEAQSQGDVTFFQFQPPKVSENEVELTLEARIARRPPEKGMLGLSNLHVKFRKLAGKWESVGEPIYFAA